MAERKVLNKYIPPDYDPVVMARNREILRKHGYMSDTKTSIRKDVLDLNPKLMDIRMMFPFTFRCSACKDFTYVGTKFNSKAEKLYNDTYLGIVKWRFYAKCPLCKAPVIFKTDPKHGDYTLESGGVRTYDPNKDVMMAAGELKKTEEEEQQEEEEKIMHKANVALKEYQDYERLAELKRVAGRAYDREVAAAKALFDVQTRDDHGPSQDIIDEFKQEQERALIELAIGDVDGVIPDAPSGNSSRTLLFGLSTGSTDRGEGEGYPEERDPGFSAPSYDDKGRDLEVGLGSTSKDGVGVGREGLPPVIVKKKQKVVDVFSGYESD